MTGSTKSTWRRRSLLTLSRGELSGTSTGRQRYLWPRTRHLCSALTPFLELLPGRFSENLYQFVFRREWGGQILVFLVVRGISEVRQGKDPTPSTKPWALNPLRWHIIFTPRFLEPPLMLDQHTHKRHSQVAGATRKRLGWMKGRGGWDHWCLVSLLQYRSPRLPLTARQVNEVHPAARLRSLDWKK